MRIKGYGGGPLAAGEPLLTRPGFWSNYLLLAGAQAPERPAPEWFGEDGADADELYETLWSPESWPVFRVRSADGSGVLVVFRNLEEDEGVDYLRVHPDRTHAELLAKWEGEREGAGLPWPDMVRIADSPAPGAGVREPHLRLLLLLPLLDEPYVPEGALPRIAEALTAAGTPPDMAHATAGRLLTALTGRVWHDADWGPSWRDA
ncbi:hypothetical protein H9Y04_31225 [Streptomyces sp. TRM66268-LWL]|uniref:Uncharacterized protein n=1 Tax=Streptomyces polyasparticus TaxID=2767826 RepID=A0ABR7SQ32_9ACTN|nr:hypothetical protein [Streptomyces polyasparticus]MBC9717014.1 hypothetical protein [Streptomyces polyasparticus]